MRNSEIYSARPEGTFAQVRSRTGLTRPRGNLNAMLFDILIWFGISLALLATAYALTQLFWQPERNIDRTRLGHWFRSLIRLYESDSLVRVSHRGTSLRLTLLRRAGEGSRCWVVLSCPRALWTAAKLGPVRAAIAAEPGVLILPDLSGSNEDRLDVQLSIPDIWSSDATDALERIAQRVLDAFGIGPDARFDLEFMGQQSMERALEARRRQRDGSLEEW